MYVKFIGYVTSNIRTMAMFVVPDAQTKGHAQCISKFIYPYQTSRACRLRFVTLNHHADNLD
jgi:hypothetical protein